MNENLVAKRISTERDQTTSDQNIRDITRTGYVACRVVQRGRRLPQNGKYH